MSCKRSNTTNCGNIVWNAITAACPQSGRFVLAIFAARRRHRRR
ncbi:MAG: hypothetical protein PUP92_11690 [Rhizonema sp. PD38]|nr:hypothetical protein [Rhizonema sp. PD38]